MVAIDEGSRAGYRFLLRPRGSRGFKGSDPLVRGGSII